MEGMKDGNLLEEYAKWALERVLKEMSLEEVLSLYSGYTKSINKLQSIAIHLADGYRKSALDTLNSLLSILLKNNYVNREKISIKYSKLSVQEIRELAGEIESVVREVIKDGRINKNEKKEIIGMSIDYLRTMTRSFALLYATHCKYLKILPQQKGYREAICEPLERTILAYGKTIKKLEGMLSKEKE